MEILERDEAVASEFVLISAWRFEPVFHWESCCFAPEGASMCCSGQEVYVLYMYQKMQQRSGCICQALHLHLHLRGKCWAGRFLISPLWILTTFSRHRKKHSGTCRGIAVSSSVRAPTRQNYIPPPLSAHSLSLLATCTPVWLVSPRVTPSGMNMPRTLPPLPGFSVKTSCCSYLGWMLQVLKWCLTSWLPLHGALMYILEEKTTSLGMLEVWAP